MTTMLHKPFTSLPSPVRTGAPLPDVKITFSPYRLPTGVKGLPGADYDQAVGRYESDVTVSGPFNAQFKGSIFPDNLEVKGRVVDGTYDVHLGFHHEGVPTQNDLRVRNNGFRAALIVNQNNPIPVISNNPAKKTSKTIHIHNGFLHWHANHTMSDGCLILPPAHWEKFLTPFLHAYPSLSDWSKNGTRVGRRVGTVTVNSARLKSSLKGVQLAYAS